MTDIAREPESQTLPPTMKAMIFERVGEPLRQVELPMPQCGPGQVLVRVAACGVCRTDLHVVDGDLDEPKLPLVLGHEIVGSIVAFAIDLAVGLVVAVLGVVNPRAP